MKPIIITIKDNKIVMDVNEFKKHIEDAYQQGYRDGSPSLTTTNDPYWWRQVTCTNTLTASDTTSGSIVGVLDASKSAL